MGGGREIVVHLLPELIPTEGLAGAVAVVIDVLRATTTIIHALAAGCTCVRPCADVDEAKELAHSIVGPVLLCGERGGHPLAGFDLGNSPREFSSKVCKAKTLVMTTTNGTRALVRSADAARILLAGFVNFSAICEQIRGDVRPVHIICAGTEGQVALEDTLLAGALIDFLSEAGEIHLNDAGRLAWDSYDNHGRVLLGALQVCRAGAILSELGYDEDIQAAAQVDQFHLVPELRRDPLRIEVGAVGIAKSHWPK